MSTGVLSVAYGLCLVYLFMGIGIVAEIFMEAIEKITSEKVVINIVDNDYIEGDLTKVLLDFVTVN